MNTVPYPLNLVGCQGSQVTQHAKTLVGTVNTASLKLTAEQIGVYINILNEFPS